MNKNKPNNVLIDDYELLDQGFELACLAVGRTMGAEGKLSLLDQGDQIPRSSKDGISVLRHIRFPNKTMNWGALQAVGGALRTLSLCGDATSTTSVLMGGYIKNIKRKYFNKAVERGILQGVEEVYQHLEELSVDATDEDIFKIAKVACNNDDKLANVVIEAFKYAGKNGIVDYTINKNKETTEFIGRDGMFIDSHGYASPFFINKEDKQVSYEGENVAVICSATWEYSQHVISQIQLFYTDIPRSTPLVVFIEKSNSDMVEKLIGIKKVGFNICLVAVSSYDEFEGELLLNDIANLTGASVYDPRNPESKIVFGIADKLTVTLENTSIVVNEVPLLFAETLEKLEKSEKPDIRRIKRLKTKASIIEVGSLSEQSASEIADRIEDSIGAVKSVMKNGYIVGGGAGLVYISGLMNKTFKSKEEQRGYDLVIKVLREPFMTILENSNRSQPKWYHPWKKNYLGEALENYGKGYNSIKDDVSNLLEDGVIDSAYSLKIAVESATERAIQHLNTSIIIHFPESQTLESH